MYQHHHYTRTSALKNCSNHIRRSSNMSSRKRSAWVPINQDDDDDDDLRASGNVVMVEGVEDGWFTETEAMWPGQKFALALEVCMRVCVCVCVCCCVAVVLCMHTTVFTCWSNFACHTTIFHNLLVPICRNSPPTNPFSFTNNPSFSPFSSSKAPSTATC